MDARQVWSQFLLENMCSMDVMPRSIGNYCVLFVSNLALCIWGHGLELFCVGKFVVHRCDCQQCGEFLHSFSSKIRCHIYREMELRDSDNGSPPYSVVQRCVPWSWWCNSLLHGICHLCIPWNNSVSLQLTLTVSLLIWRPCDRASW